MPDGVLRETLKDVDDDNYLVIVVDEAHVIFELKQQVFRVVFTRSFAAAMNTPCKRRPKHHLKHHNHPFEASKDHVFRIQVRLLGVGCIRHSESNINTVIVEVRNDKTLRTTDEAMTGNASVE
nr:hypothetical protein [Tanacetum cinerariifolium]